MGLVFLVVAGAVLGWLTAIVLRADCRRDLQLNLAVGIAGAMIGGVLAGPLTGSGHLLAGNYNVPVLVLSLLGSIALLCAANLLRSRAPYNVRQGRIHERSTRVSSAPPIARSQGEVR